MHSTNEDEDVGVNAHLTSASEARVAAIVTSQVIGALNGTSTTAGASVPALAHLHSPAKLRKVSAIIQCTRRRA